MKNKIWIIVVAIVIVALGVGGYFLISETSKEGDLKKEIIRISELDITKDTYDVNIVTSGDYGKVEKVIKTFLSDYSKNLQEALVVLQDEKLVNILAYENYEQDGPNFEESLAFLESSKETLEKNFDYLLTNSKPENIEALIEPENLSKKYTDLYHELMFNNVNIEELDDTVIELENSKELIFNRIAIFEEVLNFLKNNQNDWFLENGQVYFRTNETLNTYNELIKKLNE